MSDIKEYKVLAANKFPKPFDKVGIKIKLKEKKAADFVKKGHLEPLEKSKPKKVTKEADKADETTS